jgi:hypothetical protein
MIDSIEAVHSDPTEDLLEGAHPGLSDAEREARKPDISRLPNALDGDGLPLFRVGEKIIIERRSLSLAGNPYLDTRTYTVLNINYENGNLDLFDEVLAQSALSSYTRGPDRGFIFKLAKGNVVATKKKRGRPRKNPLADESLPPPPPPTDEHGNPIKKRRGRPPGTKNRDRETIKLEKKAKMSLRSERKARRRNKK